MTDAKLMQAVLLALTSQNVTYLGGQDGIILDDFNGIYTTGWVEDADEIYGTFGWQSE